MKNLLLFPLCFFLSIKEINAQVPAAMPVDANDFYNNSMPFLRPQVKSIVLQTANAMNHHKANADSLLESLRTNKALKNMSSNDIEGIVVLIMVQASKNADVDLKNMVMGINHKNEQENRSRPQISSQKNAGTNQAVDETQNLQLQRIMNHKSDMAEEVTYVMKKISGNQQDIINNLK